MDIDKIFVINLKDKEHRWKKFCDIDDRIERFEAIDTRTNPFLCDNYGLSVKPVGLTNELYFSQSFGAVGCYLSHYLLWKKVVDQNLKWALILEDDARHTDVIKFLEKGIKVDDFYGLVQLNKRTSEDINVYTKYFNGTESYLISNLGARKLINFTHDHSDFNNIVKALPLDGYLDLYPMSFACYKNEPKQDWSTPNSISAPVDKFIGYCANPRLPFDKRLRIKLARRIQLFCQNVPSDITDSKDVPSWERDEAGVNELIHSEKFKWWENKLQKK